MRIFVIAGSHASPAFKPANAPVMGIEVHAPAPDGNDGLDALLRQPDAQGVDVTGLVCDQTGQRRVCPFTKAPA